MGTLSIAQMGHLYWLGRYLERVKMTLDVSNDISDLLIDDESGFDVHELCERLAIPDSYRDADEFMERYLFDEDDPNSIISNLNRAFDNGVVLRDCIKSPTLSYIQLALDTLQTGETSTSPMLEVQQTLDYLYAFWGALGDYVPDVRMRYAVRVGGSVERVDLALRLGLPDDRVQQEVARLADRVYRSQMDYDPEAFQRLLEGAERLDGEADSVGDRPADVREALVSDVENLIYL